MNNDVVKELRRACSYENVTPAVRSFQSGATNGLVIDAASEIDRLQAALMDIIEVDHYPDATIARRALGMPVTPQDHLE